VVEVPVRDALERLDRLLQRHRRSGDAGELLRHVGVLREELLDAAGACHRHLVLLGELVDAQDGDDVLQFLVLLEDLLHPGGHVVVVLPHVRGVQDAGGGRERVDGGVQAPGGDLA